MKKIFAFSTLICYMLVTFGVIVNFHYCMDRLASTQLFAAESSTCAKCGMHIKKSHGCCRDEVKVIKMEVDQKTTPGVSFELPSLDAIVQLPSQFLIAAFINPAEKSSLQNHSPPLLTEQDTYLQNCVFRI